MSKSKTKLKNQLKAAKQVIESNQLRYNSLIRTVHELYKKRLNKVETELMVTNLRLEHTEEVCQKRTEDLEKEKQNSAYWKEVAIKATKDRSDFFRGNCKLERNLELWRVLAIVSSIGFLILLAQ